MRTQEYIKRLVCSSCWQDVFASEQFRLLCACGCRYWGECYPVSGEKTVKEINDGVNAGCNWCTLLYPFTSRFRHGRDPTKVLLGFDLRDQLVPYSTPCGKNSFDLLIRWTSPDPDDNEPFYHAFHLHAFTEYDDPAALFVTARPLQRNVYSESVTKQIKKWLMECSSHEQCASQLDKPLPTRVIEIAPQFQPEQPRLLVPSIENIRHGKYVALSYCWGGECQNVLTKLNQNEKQIRLDDLGKTFREAIAVTKAMGLPYLWIDALCILQDDKRDQQFEISRMDQIYQNSILTIVAACSSKISQGFLHKRPKPKKSHLLPFRISEDRYGTFFLGMEDHTIMDYYEDSEPIHSRAWTLQENILAPRYLVYSSHTLQWRCKSGVRNLGDSLYLRKYPDCSSDSRSLYVLGKVDTTSSEELRRWFKLVENYTFRVSSYSHDKLNAISAIAKGFFPTLGPDYFAGVWSYSILPQLMWQTGTRLRTDTTNTRPIEYRAPSWSWASIDGPLTTGLEMCKEFNDSLIHLCDFVSCEIVPKLKGFPFGEILSGSIKLRAVLREAWLNPSSEIIYWLTGDGSLSAAEEAYNNRLRSMHNRLTSNWLRSVPGYLGPPESLSTMSDEKKILGYHDEGHTQLPGLVFCLPVVTWFFFTEKSCGLLLVETEAGTNVFKRVGHFKRAYKSEFIGLQWREIDIV